MDIRVSGHQVDTGGALQSQVNDRLQAIATKYFSRAHSAHATFSKGPHDHGFVCDIILHVVRGVVLKASASAQEARFALDGAADKIEKQLRRYKRRLKDHHRDRQDPIETIGADSYVLSAEYTEDAEPESLQPMIVAEMQTPVQTLSVGEAVMAMELSGASMLVFRNSKHGGVNVIHTREDGNIGWIDPRNSR